MKKVIAALVVAAVVVGVFYLISTREGDIVLELKLKPGQVDKYRVIARTNTKTPGIMPRGMDTETTMLVTQEVLSVKPDGSATIETSFTEGTVELKGSESPSFKIPPPRDQRFTMTVSKTGRILDDTDRKEKVASGAGSGGSTDWVPQAPVEIVCPLPGRGINVGQAWTEKTPFPLGGGDIETTSTVLTDKASVGKRKVCKIRQEYSGKIDLAEMMESAPSPPGGMSMSGEMDISGTGTVFFSREEGKVIESHDKMKILWTMTLGGKPDSEGASSGGSMTMETTTDTDTRVELID